MAKRRVIKRRVMKVPQKKKVNSLDKAVNIVIIVGAFLCSLIFLSGGITGNTILDSSVKLSNIVGAGLFIVGVVASFIYSKRR
jgi:hypothetical protein